MKRLVSFVASLLQIALLIALVVLLVREGLTPLVILMALLLVGEMVVVSFFVMRQLRNIR